jgi:hypothetical protein
MNDEHENLRMKEATNELAILISSLNIWSQEMHIKNICANDKRGNC